MALYKVVWTKSVKLNISFHAKFDENCLLTLHNGVFNEISPIAV